MRAYYLHEVRTAGEDFPNIDDVPKWRFESDWMRVPRGTYCLWSFKRRWDAKLFRELYPLNVIDA